MADNETKPTSADVSAFRQTIADPARKRECLTILDLMRKVTKEEPKMWGAKHG